MYDSSQPTSSSALSLALDMIDATLPEPDNPVMAANLLRVSLFLCPHEQRVELAITVATDLAIQVLLYMQAAQQAGVDTEGMRAFARMAAEFGGE